MIDKIEVLNVLGGVFAGIGLTFAARYAAQKFDAWAERKRLVAEIVNRRVTKSNRELETALDRAKTIAYWPEDQARIVELGITAEAAGIDEETMHALTRFTAQTPFTANDIEKLTETLGEKQ